MDSVRILIVEDDAILVAHLEIMLTQMGYRVAGLAATGESAVEVAWTQRPDAILMDIRLRGDMTGLQAATEIQRRFSIPIVYLTAYTDEALLQQAKHTEAYAYLTKPVREHELRATLEMALYKHQAEQRLKHLTQVLRALRGVNQLMTHERDPQRLLDEACQILMQARGYRFAWIGRPAESRLKLVACGGEGRGFIDLIVATATSEQGQQLPGTTAARIRQAVVCHDLLHDERYAPWREQAEQARFLSTIAVPMLNDGQFLGILNVYADQTDFFDAEEVDLLLELAGDLAFGLKTIDEEAERKRAEAALQDSEARYRTLIESSPDGIAVHQNGQIVFVNPAGVRGFGANSPADLVGRSIADFVHPDHWPATQVRVERLLKGEPNLYPVEDCYIRLDGTAFPVEMIAAPIIYAGAPALQVVVRDITDRKHAEAAIRASEERYRSLIENMNEVVMEFNTEANFVYLSPNYVTQFGYELADEVGQSAFRHVHPDDRPQVQQALINVVQTQQTDVAFRVRTQAGEWRWLESSGRTYQAQDGRVRVISVSRDVTERKRAEEQLRASQQFAQATIDALSAHMCVLDEQGVILSVNRAWREFAEANPPFRADYWVGANYLEISQYAIGTNSAEAQPFADGLRSVIRGDCEQFSLEYPCDAPDQVRWFEARVTRFMIGDALRIVITHENITVRKQAEATSLQLGRQLELILNSAGEGIFGVDVEGCITFINPTLATMLGWEVAELLGQAAHEMFHHTRSDGRAYPRAECPMFWSLQQGSHHHIENEILWRKDGTSFPVEYTSTPIREGERLCGAVVVITDITERRRAEEAQRMAEAEYRVIFEQAPVGIFQSTPGTGQFRRANPALARMFGYDSPTELVQSITSIAKQMYVDAGLRQEFQRQLAEHGEVRDFETLDYHRDGHVIWNSINARVIRNAVGDIDYYEGFITDITERKRAEAAERDQRTLAESLRDSIAALSSTLNFDEVLDRLLNSVGRVVPHDAANIMLLDSIQATPYIVRANGYAERGPSELVLQLDEPVSGWQTLAQMMDRRRAMVISDVTRSTEWHSLPDLGWVRSYVGAPIRIKGETIGFLNLDSATPDFFTAVQADRLQAFADQAAVAIENSRLYQEISHYAEDLETRVADRTRDLRTANAQLAAANERLQELDRLKSKFVSDVSHELRTPITSLALSVDLLEHGKPEKREKYLDIIRQQVQRQTQLIEDILNVSRLELGADKAKFTPVSLNTLIAQLVNMHRPMAEAKNLSLTFTPDPALSLMIGEENQLAQVFTNLISNALNYTPTGSIRVSTAARGREVLIEVRDTGLGIAPTDLPHLFERFYRGSHTREIRGTGLGLAIVKEIVDLHGGRIEVNSEVGNGSVFHIWLPIEAQ